MFHFSKQRRREEMDESPERDFSTCRVPIPIFETLVNEAAHCGALRRESRNDARFFPFLFLLISRITRETKRFSRPKFYHIGSNIEFRSRSKLQPFSSLSLSLSLVSDIYSLSFSLVSRASTRDRAACVVYASFTSL